jgi:hypothetical protein
MDEATKMNESVDLPIPQRISALEKTIESFLGKFTHILDMAAPVAAFVPGVGAVVTEVDAAAHFAEKLLDVVDGGTVDAAALAAGQISTSTGDSVLDSRLAKIESMLAMVWPVVAAIGKEFGFELPSEHAPAADVIG